ncbi:MAG: hypothetical protein MUF00_09980 [Gemmatimonadaceae bacterium]|nr:hypothetical protein [Gemmatimonadaceae bacterium]
MSARAVVTRRAVTAIVVGVVVVGGCHDGSARPGPVVGEAVPIVVSLTQASRSVRVGDTIALGVRLDVRTATLRVGSIDVVVPFETARLLPLDVTTGGGFTAAALVGDTLRVSAIAPDGVRDGSLATIRVLVRDAAALAGLTPIVRSVGSTTFADLHAQSGTTRGVRTDAP